MDYSVIANIKAREIIAGRFVHEVHWPEWDSNERLKRADLSAEARLEMPAEPAYPADAPTCKEDQHHPV